MKIKKKTGVWLAIALILTTIVYIKEVRPWQPKTTSETEQTILFNFTPEQIKTLTIQTPQETLKFVQTQSTPPQWRMILPEEVEASNSSVMFLVNLLVSTPTNHSFTISNQQKSDYGLDQPQGLINIELTNQQQYQLILGGTNFNENLIYAQVKVGELDNQESITVKLLPIAFYYGINRDLKEWQKSP